MISGNMVGSYSQMGKTFILVDEDGNEITGVCVDNPVVFTANAAEDIREGKVAATDVGVVVGETTIPNYETSCGYQGVMPGENFIISNLSKNDLYNYTFLQCIITSFSTSVDDSVCTEYVVINDAMYESKSTTKISTIIKDNENSIVNLNMINDTENTYIIRYVTYKEVV